MKRYLARLLFIVLPVSRCFNFRRWLLAWCGIDIDKDVRFCGGGGVIGDGKVVIGAGTWLSPGVVIYSHKDIEINIGKNCDIGHEVKMIPGTHHIGNETRRAGHGIALPITIGDGCWIGAGSIILGGVTIGAGVIIAAGSVVNKDIHANQLAAGVPAKVKKKLI